MRKLKVLAFSDLHLGEPEGLLNDKGPNIVDIVVNKVSELAKGDGDLEAGIEELILIGDIADLSEAKEKEAYTNTKTFLTTLLKSVPVDKVVYIPGNHDHNLWVKILEQDKKKKYAECTPKTGLDIKNIDTFKNALKDNWFIPDSYNGEVEAHYPFYEVKIESSHFFFDHGHLFSPILTGKAGNVNSLDMIEENTYRFMEKVWFQGKKGWTAKVRERVYDWFRWAFLRISHPSRGTTFKEDSTPLYDDDLRANAVKYLENMVKVDKAKMEDFHLVFGHTHAGGRVRREDRKFRVNDHFITLWNTGGWLVPSEVFSPDAYVFYIERTQNELKPQAYKFVAKKDSQEGDYNRSILDELVKRIG
ncbi:MAG TPA: metallophosphoesterase [Candidatus Brocadiia bacterium]|nr:metallophosphoesterase [Candidatus Brocadiales bacterium]